MKPFLTFCLSISLISFSAIVAAQPSNDPIKMLVGANSKKWVYENTQRQLGSNQECKAGQNYTFKADKTVVHRRCIDGRWDLKSYQWSSRVDGFDHYISFRGKEYRVSAAKKRDEKSGFDKEVAILRIDATTKGRETEDIKLFRFR